MASPALFAWQTVTDFLTVDRGGGDNCDVEVSRHMKTLFCVTLLMAPNLHKMNILFIVYAHILGQVSVNMTEVRHDAAGGTEPGPTAQKGAQALEGIAIFANISKEAAAVHQLAIFPAARILPLSTTFRLLRYCKRLIFVYRDSQLGWWHIGLRRGLMWALRIFIIAMCPLGGGPAMHRLMLLSGGRST